MSANQHHILQMRTDRLFPTEALCKNAWAIVPYASIKIGMKKGVRSRSHGQERLDGCRNCLCLEGVQLRGPRSCCQGPDCVAETWTEWQEATNILAKQPFRS